MAYQRKLERDILCPLEVGLEIFSSKWNCRILCALHALGPLRYSNLRRHLGAITDAVLASCLRCLVSNGILLRTSYDEIPPRVEYSLSSQGQAVVPILQSLCQWAESLQKTPASMRSCQSCEYRQPMPPAP